MNICTKMQKYSQEVQLHQVILKILSLPWHLGHQGVLMNVRKGMTHAV